MVSNSPIPWNMCYIVLFQIKYFGKIKYFSYLPTLSLIMMVTGNTKLISLGLRSRMSLAIHRIMSGINWVSGSADTFHYLMLYKFLLTRTFSKSIIIIITPEIIKSFTGTSF